jgi:hypothetical protein
MVYLSVLAKGPSWIKSQEDSSPLTVRAYWDTPDVLQSNGFCAARVQTVVNTEDSRSLHTRLLRFPAVSVFTLCYCRTWDIQHHCHRVITQLQLNKYYYYYIPTITKMKPTEGSETSATLKPTPGKYPKEDIQQGARLFMSLYQLRSLWKYKF